MTEGLLSDKKDWEITGTEICQERECAVIEGTTDVYGIRWNVTHFKIKGNTAQRTARQMRRRFFVRLYSDDDAILYVSLGGTVQDDGKDASR